MSVTMQEIAERCNTSRGTVDRVINKRGKVSEELEKKILDMAKNLGYETNIFGKILSNSKLDRRVVILLDNDEKYDFDDFAIGVDAGKAEAVDYGMSIVFESCNIKDERYLSNKIDEMVDIGVNAIVIPKVNSPYIQEKLKEIEKYGIVILETKNSQSEFIFIGEDFSKEGEMLSDVASLYLRVGEKVLIVYSENEISSKMRRDGFISKIRNDIDFESFDITKGDFLEKLSSEEFSLVMFAFVDSRKEIAEMSLKNLKNKIVAVGQNEMILVGLQNGRVIASVVKEGKEQGYKLINVLKEYFLKDCKLMKRYYISSKLKMKNS